MDHFEYNLLNLITLLDDNERVKLGDITLRKTGENEVTVIGWTDFVNIDNISKDIANRELLEIKEIYRNLVETSPDFKKYMADKRPVFELWYDYKTGGILICSLKDNESVSGL